MNRDKTTMEILDVLDQKVREHDIEERIMFFAILCAVSEKNGKDRPDMLAGYTKRQYKRSIRRLREAQSKERLAAKDPVTLSGLEDTISYIRRHCLLILATVPRLRVT